MTTLTTNPSSNQTAINIAIETATMRWRRNKQPNTFRTKVPTRQRDVIEHVQVHIYHHETFPQGGQTFTVDVRELPRTDEQYGELLHRDKIQLAASEVNA